mmetsp:Transcript_56468/g.160322  ORF Transcript_56468/g.160322 Transcript_56468/m.160322 type:complete len:83 (-) Transcript_56468:172-420(-)
MRCRWVLLHLLDLCGSGRREGSEKATIMRGDIWATFRRHQSCTAVDARTASWEGSTGSCDVVCLSEERWRRHQPCNVRAAAV